MLATYRNDNALSNYPFVDGVVLPFPQSVIRDLKILLHEDVETGEVTREDVYLTRVSISNSSVSITLSNGCHGTAQDSYSYGELYNTANTKCGWFLTGAIPEDTKVNSSVNIKIDCRCIAILKGVNKSPNICIVTVNGIKYHIKDTIEVSFASGMRNTNVASSVFGISRSYEISDLELNVEDLGYPTERANVNLVTAIAAGDSTAAIDDHVNNDPDVTLRVEAVYPLMAELTNSGHIMLYGKGSECANYLLLDDEL